MQSIAARAKRKTSRARRALAEAAPSSCKTCFLRGSWPTPPHLLLKEQSVSAHSGRARERTPAAAAERARSAASVRDAVHCSKNQHLFHRRTAHSSSGSFGDALPMLFVAPSDARLAGAARCVPRVQREAVGRVSPSSRDLMTKSRPSQCITRLVAHDDALCGPPTGAGCAASRWRRL